MHSTKNPWLALELPSKKRGALTSHARCYNEMGLPAVLVAGIILCMVPTISGDPVPLCTADGRIGVYTTRLNITQSVTWNVVEIPPDNQVRFFAVIRSPAKV